VEEHWRRNKELKLKNKGMIDLITPDSKIKKGLPHKKTDFQRIRSQNYFLI
jgi:hypothetical protein